MISTKIQGKLPKNKIPSLKYKEVLFLDMHGNWDIVHQGYYSFNALLENYLKEKGNHFSINYLVKIERFHES
jgi:hypothetical protein